MIRDTFNPGNQQTITPTPGGGFMIRDTFNPGNQQTITPNLSGGFSVRETFGNGNQRTVSPNGIGGYSVQDPFDSSSHQTISPNVNGGFTVRDTFGGNNFQQRLNPIPGYHAFPPPKSYSLPQGEIGGRGQSSPYKPMTPARNNFQNDYPHFSSPAPTDGYSSGQVQEYYGGDQYSTVQSNTSETPEEVWEQAQAMMERKDFAEAKRLFQSLIDRDPPIVPAYNQLGYILAEVENNPKDAFLMFEEGFILGDASPQAIQNLAISYYKLGSIDHAASFTRLFFNQGYCSSCSMEMLATLAKTTTEYEEAIRILEKVPEQFSQKRDQILGRLYFYVGNFASAAVVLQATVTPGLSEIDEMAILAISQHVIGKTTESIRTADEIGRISPEKGEKLIELLSQISVDNLIGR